MMYLLIELIILSCFAANVLSAPRIIGGHDAPEHAYRYQVSLQRNGSHFCSGSILTVHYVLTSANCVKAVPHEEIEVVAGTNHLDYRPQVYSVEAPIVHEKFVQFLDYDIAVVRITRDFEFNDHVQPVRIPERDLTKYNKTVVATGWGVLDVNDAKFSNNLQELFLDLYKYDYETEVMKRHVYTLTKEGEGICFGDFGGPLTYHGVQLGIASYAVSCAHGKPDVYTRVYPYASWIASKIYN